MKKTTTALIVINNGIYFTGLLPTARFLKESEKYNPLILFVVDYPTLQESIALCQEENIPYLTALPIQSQKPSSNNFFSVLLAHLKENFCIGQLLNKIKPAVILLGADNIWYNSSQFIKIGHQHNIPSVVMPQFMASAREPAEAVIFNPHYDANGWWNKQIGRVFPKWLYRHHHKNLIRLPGSQVLVKELLRLSPPMPWVLHSGYSDAIAVESPFMMEYCLSEGLPKEQIHLVGSPQNDILADGLKNQNKLRSKIYRKLKLPKNKPLILAALPADFLYGIGGRPDCEFKTYRSLVKFWVRSLVKYMKYNVIISLHPTVDLETMKYIDNWGARVTKEPILNLIPLCDFFIAGVSSTVQWAAACGKPSIVYDVYKFRYTDYLSAQGIKNVELKRDFLKYLKKLANDRKFYQEMVQKQEDGMKYWGMLDGKSEERILRFLKEIDNDFSKKI